jgi:hypothetical protein
VLRTGWRPGPATGDRVLVAVTDFRADRRRDLPAVARAGLDLARGWPELPGAVGMWLWALPWGGRSGSVSVWESEEALAAFVRWPPHVRVVRRFHGSGTLRGNRWWMPSFDREQVWREARELLVR